MPLISVTRLRLRRWWYLPSFSIQSLRSSRQAAAAPGNLGVRLLRDRANTYWTTTCWQDEASMKAFMHAGAHGKAMRQLLEWCDEAAVVHWSQEGTTLPTWSAAYERLRRDGRRSKVNHPSPAHTAYEFPKPVDA